MESRINLHLVWLGSQHNQKNIDDINKIDPDCKVKLWLDDSILHPSWRETYKKFAVSYQMKSDLLRLSSLRKFGGLYIDFDCSIFTPIKNIIKDWNTLTLPTLGNTLFYMGDIIYCPIDWPYWHLIDNYIINFNTNKLTQVTFGHLLFSSLPRNAIHPIIDTQKFPSNPREMTKHCLIRRYPITKG